MGKPRDYATGDVLTTDDYGFYHRGGLSDLTRRREAMRWHWDPAVESIWGIPEYPHHLICTESRPMILEFYNNIDQDGDGVPDTAVIQDFTVWIFECSEEDWADVEQYFRGIYNYYHALGGISLSEIRKALWRE